ncbi:MAG: hypothetical protein GWP56_06935 [Gammaproteobacteria bacterium]|jgi:hypothetical protein|nr:hypothetical protein [Gammaproteobacteria bacterium]
MHKHLHGLCGIVILLFAWNAHAASEIWQDVSPAEAGARAVSEIRYFQANDTALRSALLSAPHETSGRLDHQVPIPMPDGNLVLFSVQESPIMAPELAAKYPGIRTFKVSGVEDKHAMGRIDITPLGFHGMIQTSAGAVFVDPNEFNLHDHIYRSRYAASEPRRTFNCGVDEHARPTTTPLVGTGRRSAPRVPGSLLEYDLAVAVTNEYYVGAGNTDGSTTTAIVTTINRVNFVYQRDFGIKLQLIGNNDLLYESTDNGVLDNENEFALLGQVNDWIDTRLPNGDDDYDIGHMFSQPSIFGGGIANIGAVCDSSIKAGGVSGLNNPVGDAFDIDLVAHEIGHQFNAEHSFNGTTSACVNRNSATAYEPGSGSTIMAYAGICAAENLQTNSDASFHAGSIAQVDAFTAPGATGRACATQIPTSPAGNADPSITAIANTTIPANTPFLLEGSATDTDGDTLEYRWDQMDAGCPTDDSTFGTDNGSNALFRSHRPRPESWRNFPALGTQVLNFFDKAEVLACHDRALDFRLTATDARSGQNFEDVRVVVDAAAGPFVITNLDPAPSIVAGTAFAVDWDVAGTDSAPVDCANVDIDLLTFSAGYSSYSVYSLSSNTANDGTELVTINPPGANHPRARVRVKCSDNIFYDISDADLSVTPVPPADPPLADNGFTTRFYANIATTGVTAPACGPIVDCSAPAPPGDTGSGEHDASALGHAWLLLLGGLAALRRIRCRQG